MLGFHPQSPERRRPRRRFEHGITFYLNLYVNLPCPREMGNAHFSNVKPMPVKYSDNLHAAFREKDLHQYPSV